MQWYANEIPMPMHTIGSSLSGSIVCISIALFWYGMHCHFFVWYALAMVWYGMVCIANENGMHFLSIVWYALAMTMYGIAMEWYGMVLYGMF
jgi:hypothetical protein